MARIGVETSRGPVDGAWTEPRGTAPVLVLGHPLRTALVVILADPVVELGGRAEVAGHAEGAGEAQLVHGRPLRVGDVHAGGAVHGAGHTSTIGRR